MSSYVSNFEERYYEVHPSQVRWAMSQLGGMPGYNVQGYAPAQNGMYIVVVQVPVGAEQQDWRAAPPRRRWPRVDVPRLARGLALAAIAVALAYIAYSMFTGAALDTSTQNAIVAPTAPAIEMPWDAAGRQVGETIDGVVRILMAGLVAAVVAVFVAVAVKVRGMVKK